MGTRLLLRSRPDFPRHPGGERAFRHPVAAARHPWPGADPPPCPGGWPLTRGTERSSRRMVCLPAAPPALALRTWLGLGLLALLCLGLGQAREKRVVRSKLGENVSLSCCHEIPRSESLQNYRTYWQKKCPGVTLVVLAYSDGTPIEVHDRYKNRTEMDPWDLILRISPMEILDNGTYQCVVQHNSVVVCDESVTLFVTADFSQPSITAEVSASSCESAEMVIVCSSHGGFPKPRISGALNNVSVEWNASWVSESSPSPYNVTGTLVLNVTSDVDVNVTCSVEHDGLAKSTSLLLEKTNDCVVPPVPPPYNVITASSIVVITFILAIILAARYLPRRVCPHCCKPQDPVEEGMKEGTKPPVSLKVTSETSSV